MKAWIRLLEVIFTSDIVENNKRRQLIFKNNLDKESLYISVTGTKYLSALKDEFTIVIKNATYREVLELIDGKYFSIEIRAGYKEGGVHSLFKGSVMYISNSLDNKKTNSVIILCASKLVAAYGQSRMNLTMNSGVNMYSALSYILRKSGANNNFIDSDFKNRILKETETINSTVSSWLDAFSKTNNLVVNTDSTLGNIVSIWSPYRKDARIVECTSKNILLTGGFPTVSSQGINFSVLPTFNFVPGDTCHIDNSIFNIAVRNSSEITENQTLYLSKTGMYIIYKLNYNLTNRDGDFSINITAKSKDIIQKFIGESK